MRGIVTRSALVLGLLALAPLVVAGDDPPKGADELVGVYIIQSGEREGAPEPAERVKGSMVRFSTDRVVVTDKESKEIYGAEYKLDTSSKPWKITMTSKLAPEEGRVARGIIEKSGDTVRLAYGLPGGEAPTDFHTKGKQLFFVMTKKGD